MAVEVDIKQLLEAGVHFGHKTSRWHPKMAPFIHSKRQDSHIIDLTHGNRKKADRIIWSLQGRFEHGRIILNSKKDWSDFNDQLLMFPAQGVHDDLPDALSYIDQLAVTSYFEEENEDYIWRPMDILSGV
jgi:hypothetical protein